MSQVAFRRIHGHIVPIKINDPDHNRLNKAIKTAERQGATVIRVDPNKAKGAALIAAGAGAAYATGKTSAKLMHESALVENTARVLQRARHEQLTKALAHGPLFAHAAAVKHGAVHEAARFNIRRSKQLEKAAFRLRGAGTVASGALIAAGAHKILTANKNENPKTNAAIATGSGVAAAFVIRSAYLRGVGMRGFQVLKHAARRAALKL